MGEPVNKFLLSVIVGDGIHALVLVADADILNAGGVPAVQELVEAALAGREGFPGEAARAAAAGDVAGLAEAHNAVQAAFAAAAWLANSRFVGFEV